LITHEKNTSSTSFNNDASIAMINKSPVYGGNNNNLNDNFEINEEQNFKSVITSDESRSKVNNNFF